MQYAYWLLGDFNQVGQFFAAATSVWRQLHHKMRALIWLRAFWRNRRALLFKWKGCVRLRVL